MGPPLAHVPGKVGKGVKMKSLILLQIALTFGASIAQANETCKVKTTDVGTIVGKGSTQDSAFEDAATKCYDLRAQLFKAHHGRVPAEDDGLAIIDVCANVRCS